MENNGRFTLKKIRTNIDISDAEVIEPPKAEEPSPVKEPDYVLDFAIPDQPGEVTDERLLAFLNSLQPKAVSTIETAVPEKVQVTRHNYKSVLKRNDVNQTMLGFMLEISEKNPDPMVFADSSNAPAGETMDTNAEEVSPVLLMRIRDKKLKKLMKTLRLYNVITTKQDKDEYCYLFKESFGSILSVKIDRQAQGDYLSKLDAFGMALAIFLESRTFPQKVTHAPITGLVTE